MSVSQITSVREVKDPFPPSRPPIEDDGFEPSAADRAWLNATGLTTPNELFVQWIEAQARDRRILADEPASFPAWHRWLADQIDRLAQLAAWTAAAGPAEFDERTATNEAIAREDQYQRGFRDGKEFLN